MKELQPLNEQVVLDVTEEETEQKTSSGIIIPDSAKEKKKTAKVVAVSEIENAAIQAGDYVLYKEFSGVEVEMDDKNYLVIPYADILAKVVETDQI
ncbi:MAG: co-chaperone GroES [Bacteroidales bacterium]|nr:co-chaperone GroES [Bacteroidales bacterium]MBS3773922.1 co-chaperone GroES [Bacteroidales bacterium]